MTSAFSTKNSKSTASSRRGSNSLVRVSSRRSHFVATAVAIGLISFATVEPALAQVVSFDSGPVFGPMDALAPKTPSRVKKSDSATRVSARTRNDAEAIVAMAPLSVRDFAAKTSGLAVRGGSTLIATPTEVPAVVPVASAEVLPRAEAKAIAPSNDAPITVRVEKPVANGRAVVKEAVVRVHASPEKALADRAPEKISPETVAKDEVARTLRIFRRDGVLAFAPETLIFSSIGQKVSVVFDGQAASMTDQSNGLSIFVRDVGVAEWKASVRSLTAKRAGRTELYVVSAERMHIVPLTVAGTDALAGFDLAVPKALVSLDGLVQATAHPTAIYPESVAAVSALAGSSSAQAPALSLQDSIADVSRAAALIQQQQPRFSRRAESVNYTNLVLQIIDERSRPEAGAVFPVSGARVRIAGTEFEGFSDAAGHVAIRDMPRKSRYLVAIDDPSGRVRPSVVEVASSDQSDSGVIRVRTMREFTFDATTRVAGIVQRSEKASVCGRIVVNERERAPIIDVRVSVDVGSDGVAYNNRFGFIDPSARATGPDGRFCAFNIEAGPAVFAFYDGDRLVGSAVVSLFAGQHREDDFAVAENHFVRARLAVVPAPHEQLSSNKAESMRYTAVDAIDLLPLGSDRPMVALDNGILGTDGSHVIGYRGRMLAVARAAEFEQAVYDFSVDRPRDGQIVPLLPRGFIEDMAHFAQIEFDSSLGAVVVEHGDLNGQGGESVNLRLVNSAGFDVGDGWYYSDAPVTKAIFFNVPPGTWSLVVETKNRYWLAAEVVTVFSETVSFVQTGSRIRYSGE